MQRSDDASGDALIKKGEAFTQNLRTLPFEQYERITIEDGEDLEEKVQTDKVREKETKSASATPLRLSVTRRVTSSAPASSSSRSTSRSPEASGR